jgi:transglutaminase-like putative cysteine protease
VLQASLNSEIKNDPVSVLRWKQGAIFSAFVAMLTVQMFRMAAHQQPSIMWTEAVIFALVPIFLHRLIRIWAVWNPEVASVRKITHLVQAGIVGSIVLLIAWQVTFRSLFAIGDANEVVVLNILQLVGWQLAIFSSVRGFERASLVLCGSVVFFVCCMTSRIDIFVLGSFFAVASLWWMAGLYWSRLDSKAIDGDAKTLAIHGSSTGIAVVAILLGVGISLLIPFSRGQFSVRGFMPFSGGEDGYQDDFATSGVGDGNMLKAGDDATTTGAVDTDQFIEDDKPSMYDVMSEKYDGPVFKKKLNKAVALRAKTKHVHDIKQSEQAGRTFRTMRKTGRELDIDYEDRISKALFYVEGSVPARFINDAFHDFDGWDWNKVDIAEEVPLQAKIKLNKTFGKPIFSLARAKSDYLTNNRTHKVKMLRLETPVLPAPSFLSRWHIARVDRLNFFRWDDAGFLKFDSEAIPSQTVIDFDSFVPNYHVLRKASNFRRANFRDSDSPWLQVQETSAREKIVGLADQLTSGIRPGWNQVEAIVNHMRENYELNPNWETDEEAEDVVGHFLEQNGGPPELFATTCAMVLRAAGYKTRFVQGFVVRKEDYDPLARQSIVTSQNVHSWPEVCLDGRFWIPVEPTPGYPIPYSTETLWQWLMAKANAFVFWIWTHPLISFLIASTVFLCVRYRANLIASLMLGWWNVIRILWPGALLRTTRQLIDLRFWVAGDRRPLSQTIRNWYSRVEPQHSGGFFDLWNARNYCSKPPEISRREVVALCREQIDLLTLGKIQNFVSEKTGSAIS